MAKAKILICDDSEGVRESLKLILKDEYCLFFACDGYEALKIAESKSPDLVVLDIKMPGLNGIETFKELHKITPLIKVLFVTGYQYTEVARDAIQLGAIDYIVKPFTEQDLKNAVERILKKK